VLLLILLAVGQPLPDSGSAAPDTATQDVIFYGGKRVVFFARTNEVVLLDSAWVRYRDMRVRSDSIHYDIRKRTLGAHGRIAFATATESIGGTLLLYNVDTRRGMVRFARTQVENGFFTANEAWLVKERVLNAQRGTFTTCELERPHYDFYGPRVKLLMDDVAVTEPVLLRLFRVPVLAAPFWLVPVASERKSGLMAFKVGQALDQGWYAKGISYYWVINDYSDATFYLDVMTLKGVQFRTEGVYKVLPFARGSVQGSYIREWDSQRQRYAFNALHSSRFFLGTDLNAQAEFLSDRTYAPDYGEEPPEWLKQDVKSHAELRREFRGIGSVSAIAQQLTSFAGHYRSASLPSVRFSFRQRPLFGGWNLSPSASFGHRTDDYLDSTNAVDTLRLRDLRANAAVGLSGPAYALGPLGTATVSDRVEFSGNRSYRNDSLTNRPRGLSNSLDAGLEQRFLGTALLTEAVKVSHSMGLADSVLVTPGYTGSVTGRLALSRVFTVEAMGIRSVLHQVIPSIGLGYEPTVEPDGLFGRVSLLDPASAGLHVGLVNDFQAKVGEDRTKVNLGQVGLNTSVDLTDFALQPLSVTATVQPIPLFGRAESIPSAFTGSIQWNGYGGIDVDPLGLGESYSSATSVTFEYRPRDTLRGIIRGVQTSVNHTLSRSDQMVTGSLSLILPGWRFGLGSFGYNFTERELTNYNVSIWRDLHCWEALGSITRLGNTLRYDFEVRIKKLPDVKFGRSTFRPFLPGT
jgi:hypothetical protein